MRHMLRLMLLLIIVVLIRIRRVLWLMLCRLFVMSVLRFLRRWVLVRQLIRVISMRVCRIILLLSVLPIFVVLFIGRLLR